MRSESGHPGARIWEQQGVGNGVISVCYMSPSRQATKGGGHADLRAKDTHVNVCLCNVGRAMLFLRFNDLQMRCLSSGLEDPH